MQGFSCLEKGVDLAEFALVLAGEGQVLSLLVGDAIL